MDFSGGLYGFGIPFLIILTALVFIHELGHYLVARWNGVRVEVFSIGFGPELFGWTDKAGTRWKFSAIPLGGYVKMFGDANAASMPSDESPEMSEAERAVAFPHKRLNQRVWIVAAGPIANFLFAIVLLAGLFSIIGQPFTPAVVGAVVPDSAAEAAGFQAGDEITAVNGNSVARFEELQRIVGLRPEENLEITVLRDGEELELIATPARVVRENSLGEAQEVGQLGIQRSGNAFIRHDPVTAVWQATRETISIVSQTFTALGQIIRGDRGADELGGPIRIAQMSGQVAEHGIPQAIFFAAVLSINLGLINLFPIPMLDGGHLLFYAVEAVRGRPLGERAQEYGFRIGLALVLTLMVFVTWNDLARFETLANFFKGLVT
ncbi:RIP metalloprotease RseP [Pelagibius litoralis]|uniref:Zinc metalloprotease n=1 Tax=Pelagibius litoralis TaxID=374515 RepID=A0A967C2S6_9PROT|nr:RIP metalloprotease RseP [Pelagibius litoralis]NIA67300.1 RIP metalloprotease RseP [Pelagibius litoralis]